MAGPSEFSRKPALRRVHEAGRGGDVDALVNTVKREPDTLVRGAAVRELGLLGELSAVEPLRRLLSANDYGLQTITIRALARIGDVSVSNDLYELATNDRHPGSVQLTAALALVKLGDRRAIPVIGRYVVDDRFTRREMKWALKKLRKHHGVEAIPILQAGGSRHFSALDRLRIRMVLRSLGSRRTN
jgi:HEAT repeat protein